MCDHSLLLFIKPTACPGKMGRHMKALQRKVKEREIEGGGEAGEGGQLADPAFKAS